MNGPLGQFVQIEVERQLLRGTAGGNEVQGLLTGRGVPVYAVTSASGTLIIENTFKAMNGMRGSAFVEPDWVIMHPSDYEKVRLAKDTANQYYGGGPFMGSWATRRRPARPARSRARPTCCGASRST